MLFDNVTPSPRCALKNSATSAPIIASVLPTFNAVKTYGSAWGRRSFQKMSRGLAARLDISSSDSGSIEYRPLNALITIGANTISATTAILDGGPKPSQSTAIGETAMIGIELSDAAIGNPPRRRNGMLANSTAQPKPSTPPSTNPMAASGPVNSTASRHSTSDRSAIDCAIWSGYGS